MGVGAFCIFQRNRGEWPFAEAEARQTTTIFNAQAGDVQTKARYLKKMMSSPPKSPSVCTDLHPNTVLEADSLLTDARDTVAEMKGLVGDFRARDEARLEMRAMMEEVRSIVKDIRGTCAG